MVRLSYIVQILPIDKTVIFTHYGERKFGMSYGIPCGCGNMIDLAGSRICSACKAMIEKSNEKTKTFAELGDSQHIQAVNKLLDAERQEKDADPVVEVTVTTDDNKAFFYTDSAQGTEAAKIIDHLEGVLRDNSNRKKREWDEKLEYHCKQALIASGYPVTECEGDQFSAEEYQKAEMKKTRYDLLPHVLPDVCDVFTFGARKYAPHGWKMLEDWDIICFNKVMRHLTTWMFTPEKTDESGKSHLVHAIADLMIMAAREKDNHD